MNKDKKLAQVFDPQVYYCKAKRKVLEGEMQMKKSLYQSILAMLLSIVTLTPVANPVAMAAQIDHEPDSFVEELEEPDESDDAGQGKDIPDLEDVISNEDEENENSSADQIESADVDENEVIMLQLRVKAMNKDIMENVDTIYNARIEFQKHCLRNSQ